VDCSKNGNNGCDGGDMVLAYEYLKGKNSMYASDYPYTAEDDACKYNAAKGGVKITGNARVPKNNPA